MNLHDAIVKIAEQCEPPPVVKYAVVDVDNLMDQYSRIYSTVAEAQAGCTAGDYVIAIENGCERSLTEKEKAASSTGLAASSVSLIP